MYREFSINLGGVEIMGKSSGLFGLDERVKQLIIAGKSGKDITRADRWLYGRVTYGYLEAELLKMHETANHIAITLITPSGEVVVRVDGNSHTYPLTGLGYTLTNGIYSHNSTPQRTSAHMPHGSRQGHGGTDYRKGSGYVHGIGKKC